MGWLVPLPGAREPHAEAPRGALKQNVVVGVSTVGFNEKMIAIRDDGIPQDLLDAHGLELKMRSPITNV
jgi:hypothetical protein